MSGSRWVVVFTRKFSNLGRCRDGTNLERGDVRLSLGYGGVGYRPLHVGGHRGRRTGRSRGEEGAQRVETRGRWTGRRTGTLNGLISKVREQRLRCRRFPERGGWVRFRCGVGTVRPGATDDAVVSIVSR